MCVCVYVYIPTYIQFETTRYISCFCAEFYTNYVTQAHQKTSVCQFDQDNDRLFGRFAPSGQENVSLPRMYSLYWACVHYIGHVCTILDMCALCWTCVHYIGHVCTILDMCELYWTSVHYIGHVCTIVDMCALYWTCVHYIGHVCTILDMCALYWTCVHYIGHVSQTTYCAILQTNMHHVANSRHPHRKTSHTLCLTCKSNYILCNR